ncbi:MAG TPA: hypothetical protein DDZ83_11235 [Nitrospinae bacterium]|nr:hypothetical protein [Nitrospinota bacterium]
MEQVANNCRPAETRKTSEAKRQEGCHRVFRVTRDGSKAIVAICTRLRRDVISSSELRYSLEPFSLSPTHLRREFVKQQRSVRTHYDNLKVARDAPIEVIRGAYRELAKKHHPDRTGTHPESTQILQVINASYKVLSDPVLRAKHDRWIKATDRERPRSTDPRATPPTGPTPSPQRRPPEPP